MKSLLTLTALFAAAITLAVSVSHAKTATESGLDRLQANVGNAQANTDDYKRNLGIVEGNLREIGKARAQTDAQKALVTAALKENRAQLQQMEKQERELAGLVQEEKTAMTQEAQKVKELEAQIAQLKENQKKREDNIAAYQQQNEKLQEQKKGWVQRETQLKEQETQVAARLKTLNGMDGEMRNKKKGYEGEIKRWSAETDKQKKTLDQMQTLAAGK